MSSPSHQFSKTVLIPFKDIDIPPRKILFSHQNHNHNIQDMQLPYETSTLLHKYLPSNNYEIDDEDNGVDVGADPYAADHFRMYEFKVRRCTRSRSHDWTDCPFAHPGEKARRRDPRRFHYSSTICSDFRRGGGCPRGDDCDFSHGVFECWLHPTRYRTEACKDGKNCKRKVCFFAHSARELRLLPASAESSAKYKNSSAAGSCSGTSINSPMNRNRNRNNQHCCLFCHSVMTSSPTSTLLGLSHLSRSPSSSPPLSPLKQRTGFSPISRYSDRLSKFGTEMINELMMMSSLENMNIYDDQVSSPVVNGSTANIPSWIDVSFNDEDQQHQFLLSPSSSSCRPSPASGTSAGEYCFGATPINNGSFVGKDQKLSNNENGGTDPDLGWVNELLM